MEALNDSTDRPAGRIARLYAELAERFDLLPGDRRRELEEEMNVMAKTVSETLRDAIEASGLTPYRIATDAGVDTAGLYRFLSGGNLKSESVDRLCESLGLVLTASAPDRRRRSNANGLRVARASK